MSDERAPWETYDPRGKQGRNGDPLCTQCQFYTTRNKAGICVHCIENETDYFLWLDERADDDESRLVRNWRE